MNIDTITTNGIESTPSFEISAIVRLKNNLHLLGIENTLRMKTQYRPNIAIELVNAMSLLNFN